LFGLPDANLIRQAFAKYEAAKAEIPPSDPLDLQRISELVVAMDQMFTDMHAAFPKQQGKLGRRPVRFDARTLKAENYFLPSLPPPPASVVNSRHVKNWGMLGNDKLGDCTCAAVAHGHQIGVLSQVQQGITAEIIMPSLDAVIGIYERWCGYNPADPSTDQGGVELDVLNHWRQDGFEGRKILAYAAVDPQNTLHVKQAINLFGGVYIGIALPDGWQDAAVWDSKMGTPGSWGGHAVFVPDYYADRINPITWGQSQEMTWAGFKQYCEECYAIIFEDWVPPVGFDKAGLLDDLESVT